MSNFPTFTATKAIDMMEMGITHDMYVKLQKVAAENHCVIMIRKTNKGSVMPFANRTAVGKKLATKGKSSNAFFTKGNITFFSQMAKKLEDKDWFREQNTLINILKEKSSHGDASKYKFIPKLLTEKQVRDLLINQKTLIDKALGGDAFQVSDDFGGKKLMATYKLVKTTWKLVNSGDLQNLLVKPAEDVVDNTTLFRVYVKVKMSRCKFPILRGFTEHFSMTIPDNHTVKLKDNKKIAINTPVKWSDINEAVDGLWPNEANEAWNGLLGVDFANCAPQLVPAVEDANFREVRVLALRTRGEGLKDRAPKPVNDNQAAKKYYEVVADYDIFMVAPKINKLELKQLLNGNDIGITIDFNFLSVLPRLGSQNSIKKRREGDTQNPYGLLSPYDFHIRQQINRALGIKVAQHGAEIANLFYTSDIKDPVIAIYPDGRVAEVAATTRSDTAVASSALPLTNNGTRSSVVGQQEDAAAAPVGPEQKKLLSAFKVPGGQTPENRNIVASGLCFLMSMEMLFEMMNSRTSQDTHSRLLGFKELGETYGTLAGTGIEYTFHKDNFTAQYGIIMNLNWGTEAYYKFNIKMDYEYGPELKLDKDYEKLTDETIKIAVKNYHEGFALKIFDNYIDKSDNQSDYSGINSLFCEFTNGELPFDFKTSTLPISIRTLLFYLYRKNARHKAQCTWDLNTKNPSGRAWEVARKNYMPSSNNEFEHTLLFFKSVYQSILNQGIRVQKSMAKQEEHYKYDALIDIYEKAILATDIVLNKNAAARNAAARNAAERDAAEQAALEAAQEKRISDHIEKQTAVRL
ncbi:MAG: hypothetical protein EAY75_09360, partial [Bacteroidetes bacterium]